MSEVSNKTMNMALLLSVFIASSMSGWSGCLHRSVWQTGVCCIYNGLTQGQGHTVRQLELKIIVPTHLPTSWKKFGPGLTLKLKTQSETEMHRSYHVLTFVITFSPCRKGTCYLIYRWLEFRG